MRPHRHARRQRRRTHGDERRRRSSTAVRVVTARSSSVETRGAVTTHGRLTGRSRLVTSDPPAPRGASRARSTSHGGVGSGPRSSDSPRVRARLSHRRVLITTTTRRPCRIRTWPPSPWGLFEHRRLALWGQTRSVVAHVGQRDDCPARPAFLRWPRELQVFAVERRPRSSFSGDHPERRGGADASTSAGRRCRLIDASTYDVEWETAQRRPLRTARLLDAGTSCAQRQAPTLPSASCASSRAPGCSVRCRAARRHRGRRGLRQVTYEGIDAELEPGTDAAALADASRVPRLARGVRGVRRRLRDISRCVITTLARVGCAANADDGLPRRQEEGMAS